MKILNISTYDTGGAGIAAIRYHELLLKNGFDSSILFLERKKYVGKNVYVYEKQNQASFEEPTLTLTNYLLERFFSYFSKKRKLFFEKKKNDNAFRDKIALDAMTEFECFSSPKTAYDVMSTQAYQDSDIIHLHFVSDFLDYPSFFGLNKKPVFWSLHDENLMLGAFHFELDKIKNQAKYKEIDDNYFDIKLNALTNSGSKITLLSGFNWLIEKIKSSKMPLSIDVERFYYPVNEKLYHYIDKQKAKELLNLPIDKKIFLFTAGNINNKRKGFDLLIPVLEDDRFKDAIFLIMGLSTREIQIDNVIQLGQISDELLMPIIYGAADYYILPSRAEGFSYAMSEALCCGTPVIAFDVADHMDFIHKNKLGIVLPEINSDELKKCVEKILLGKYVFDNRMISEVALSYLNSEKVSKEFISFYTK